MISIRGLCKRFDMPDGSSIDVLRDIDLTVPDRTITAVIGPSGAGKTTLSKCVSLLETPTAGSILVNGKNLSVLRGDALRTERRAIGTIFQSSALLRRKTVAQNVALPLEYLGVTRTDISRRVAELLHQVGIAEKAALYPEQLSGGQRQRVGIARALALHPTVLLSDEATSGLDPEATDSILSLLRTLRDELGLSIVLITHEMDVVRTVADHVAVLRAGRIVESESVRDLIADPASAIGRQLLSVKPSRPADPELVSLELTYPAHTSVPADWITLASRHLDLRILILGAVVEDIGGRTAGRIAIGLERAAGAPIDLNAAIDYFESLGLVAAAPHRLERADVRVTSAA